MHSQRSILWKEIKMDVGRAHDLMVRESPGSFAHRSTTDSKASVTPPQIPIGTFQLVGSSFDMGRELDILSLRSSRPSLPQSMGQGHPLKVLSSSRLSNMGWNIPLYQFRRPSCVFKTVPSTQVTASNTPLTLFRELNLLVLNTRRPPAPSLKLLSACSSMLTPSMNKGWDTRMPLRLLL